MRALNIVTIHPGWQACLRRGGGGPLRLRGMRARAAMWSTTDDRCIVMAAQLARGARPVKRLSLSSYGYLPNGRARSWLAA